MKTGTQIVNRGNINDPVSNIDDIGDMAGNQLGLAQGDGILDGFVCLGTSLIKRNKVVLGDAGIIQLPENIQNGIYEDHSDAGYRLRGKRRRY